MPAWGKLASLVLVEEVGVGVFDSVVFGERKPIGVRVVDGESKCGIRSAEFGICSRGDDGDELAEEVAFGAQVGGPLGGTAVFVVFAGVDDAGADAGYFELGILKVDRDIVFGRDLAQA